MRKPSSRSRPPGGPTALQRGVTNRVNDVNTTVAFFRGSDVNDRKDFHTFVSQLTKNVTSIKMLAWAPRIPAARRNAHEEAVRKEGLSKYAISQRDDRGRLIAAGKRDEYYPILFAEPASEIQSLLGLDLGSDAASRAAMGQAMDGHRETVAVYTAFSGDKTGDNWLFVLEPARYESVATHLAKRPADQPEPDGFVLGVLGMEAIAKRWLGLPAPNIPPGIEVYIAANGKDLAALRSGSPPGPIRDAAVRAAEPPAGAHWHRRSSRLPTRTSRWCTSPRQAISPTLLEPGSLS